MTNNLSGSWKSAARGPDCFQFVLSLEVVNGRGRASLFLALPDPE